MLYNGYHAYVRVLVRGAMSIESGVRYLGIYTINPLHRSLFNAYGDELNKERNDKQLKR